MISLSQAAAAPSPAVVASAAYTAEVLTVIDGGLERGSVARGLGEVALDADITTAAGSISEPKLRVSVLLPHGGDLSGTRLGDLQGASNIATYNHPCLYELWIGGKFADGRVGLQIGRLLADAEFATTEGGAVFLNSSFGWPAFVSANTRNTGPAFSRSALGLYASVDIAPRVRWHAGVYDGDSFDDPDGDPTRYPNGLHTKLGDGQGTFVMTEVVVSGDSGAEKSSSLGSVKLGVWGHTAEFKHQGDPSRLHEGNYGFYAVGERTLWREPGSTGEHSQELIGFLRVGFSPASRSLFSETADAGLQFTGPFSGRKDDAVGVGVAVVRISNHVRRAERESGSSTLSDYEMAIEACYSIAINARWRVIPDLQWIRHPGGSDQLADALVVGLRTRIEF